MVKVGDKLRVYDRENNMIVEMVIDKMCEDETEHTIKIDGTPTDERALYDI